MNLAASGFTLFIAAAAGDVFVPQAGQLVISGTAVVLDGVDTPSPGSEIGRAARTAVLDSIDGQPVICRVGPRDVSDTARRGVCFADGVDLGAMLVRSGLALDCPRVSNGRYGDFETADSRDYLQQREGCIRTAADQRRSGKNPPVSVSE